MINRVIISDFKKIDLDNFCSTYCPAKVTKNLFEKNHYPPNDNTNKDKFVKKIELDQLTFNFNFKKIFQTLLKKFNIPNFNIILYASLQHLGAATHSVHTDSDGGFRKIHQPICRFLIPLTKASPTCYFDKLMPDNKFYRRESKFDFSVEVPEGLKSVNITHLTSLKNNLKKPISDFLPTYTHISHISPDQLYGLEVDTLGEWEIGAIHLFPCSLLHASTDFDSYDSKYMINGVIYTPK